jgi:predicted membrane channel-forming protein YqfA (hemolysin III family)
MQAWLLGAVTALTLAAVFLVSPIPQDPAYHNFADKRFLCGTPNFWNVFSNLSFLVIGAFGLARLSHLQPAASRVGYIVFCAGVVLVAFGSAYYHYAPDTQTLVWDRLPMTVAFMALFAMVIRDRVSERLGERLFWPLIVVGIASIAYWHWTETQGRGDLRVYGLVQFLPILQIPLMLLTSPGRGLRSAWLWATLATYGLSKLAEYFDYGIYEATGLLSGHTIKHLLASFAVLWAIFAFLRPRPSRAA